MALDLHGIQAKTAEYVGRYLESPDPGDTEASEDRRQMMCSAVSRLLGVLVESEHRWERGRWIDDLVPETIEVLSGRQLALRGAIWWGIRIQTSQWTDPFAAEIVLSDQEPILKAYELRFVDEAGDAIERGSFRPHKHALPEDDRWRFVFTKA